MTPRPAPAGPDCSTGSKVKRKPRLMFGFCSEPVIDIQNSYEPAFYIECLARLKMGARPAISAASFVRMLEASGEAGAIDVTILDLVLDKLASDPNLVLGCNISPYTIANPFSWSEVIRRLERSKGCASRLVLEITEGAPLDEISSAGIRLKAAKTLGCRIAIDDFGAGAASLPRLFRVEAVWDIIKLDRSCFGKIHSDRFVVNVLRPTFELASCLAPFVVIEGVETEDHLQAALAVGAQYVQGWHLPASDIQSYTKPESSLASKIDAYLLSSCFSPATDSSGGAQQ